MLNYTVRDPSQEDLTHPDITLASNRYSAAVKRQTHTATEFPHAGETPSAVFSNSFGAKVDFNTSDDAFKANYSPDIFSRKSTLSLKTGFHLINVTLMGLCKVFKIIDDNLNA